uniref:A-kinase anchor protein 2 C-terminal domain-containing protein n=1 Tax=Calidris pygmaea TaxID=425635 RepID=A0A8C3K7V6_9CHAR
PAPTAAGSGIGPPGGGGPPRPDPAVPHCPPPGSAEVHFPRSRAFHLCRSRLKFPPSPNLDSGLGEMYNEGNAGYTSDGSTSNEVFNGLVDLRDGSNGLDKEMKISNETPIEREIRMAMEREENLWKERGIPRLTSSSELVEIQTKPLLSMLTSPGPGRKGKDRGRASLYLQREIEQETKREEALKKQGRLLGTYDRGTQQELDERRRVFDEGRGSPPVSGAGAWAPPRPLLWPRGLGGGPRAPREGSVSLLAERDAPGSPFPPNTSLPKRAEPGGAAALTSRWHN